MWQVAVFDQGQHEQFRATSDRFALSRTIRNGPWQFAEGPSRPLAAQIIRFHVDGEAVTVDSRAIESPIEAAGGPTFWSGMPAELALPCVFHIGDAWFEIHGEPSVAELELEPLHASGALAPLPPAAPAISGPESETVASWLAAVGQVHRTAASSPEFFNVAARAALGSTGLDAAMILVRDGDQWQIAGSALPRPEYGVAFEPAAAAALLQRPEVWRRPPRTSDLVARDADDAASRRPSIVIAPVRDDSGALVAAVYGVRHGRAQNRRRGIRPLEARVVELLADAVGAGMARRQQELESARQQVLLEQAFAPQVVEYLRRQPDALAGQARDVTLLFADLRGFTSMAESLSPARAYELLAAVMEPLTQAVIDCGGVVIDYYGDGLSAMWNAPLETAEHADLACTSAMQMLDAIPPLKLQWESSLPRPLELGIGIHSGFAQVGNAGTRRRLKYGPRGAAVNVASRVQGASKHLDVALLITDAVRRRLSARFVTLKICTAKLPGLEQPFELFSVLPATDAARLRDDLDRYAAALAAFERGDLDAAEQSLEDLLEAGPATPAEFLAQQTAALRQAAKGRRTTDQLGFTPDAVIEILAK